MNVTKVISPADSLLTLYYYFSYTLLGLTLAMTPLMIYVTLTQSKQLKAFKWFILNHTFWCLSFEIFQGFLKPVILPPACAGFLLGMFHDLDIVEVVILMMIYLATVTNCIISLGATVACRYALVFPKTKLSYVLNMRTITIGAISFMVLSNAILGGAGYSMLQLDVQTAHKLAADYDVGLIPFLNVSSFVFVPYMYCDYGARVFFILTTVTMVSSLSVITWFIILAMKFKNEAGFSSIHYSLLISSIMQLITAFIFIVIPQYGFLISFEFEFPHMTNVFLYLNFLLVMHSLSEFIATIYFVKPYYHAVKDMIVMVLGRMKIINTPIPSRDDVQVY